MTQQDVPINESPNSPRVGRFSEGVAALDVPAPSPKAETWLVWGGIGFVVVGVIVIFAGYWGASGTSDPASQLPYMLSGGALGLAFVVVGSILIGRYTMARLFRFWLALLVAEHRSQTDRLIDAIEASNRQG